MQLRYIALFALLHTGSMKADDGAASIAAGGLVFKRETGITMAKEVLNISLRKVSVDYEFRNNTDAEIVTEIAFPVPPYRYGNTEREPEEQGFDDFHLTVEGKPVAFQSEIRATVGSKDVTEILGRYHLDAATFSHAGVDGVLADLSNLSPAQRANLIRIGVLKPISMLSGTTSVYPAWTVVKKYYWTQVFPARGVVHIHHEYTPVIWQPTDAIGVHHIHRTSYQSARRSVWYGSGCPTLSQKDGRLFLPLRTSRATSRRQVRYVRLQLDRFHFDDRKYLEAANRRFHSERRADRHQRRGKLLLGRASRAGRYFTFPCSRC